MLLNAMLIKITCIKKFGHIGKMSKILDIIGHISEKHKKLGTHLFLGNLADYVKNISQNCFKNLFSKILETI